jgi:hypothetical protein
MIKLVSPLLDPAARAAADAPRLPSLDGVVLGLLSNGKANSERLLDLIAGELSSRYTLKDIVRITKGHCSMPPSDADVELLANETLAVLTAIGD